MHLHGCERALLACQGTIAAMKKAEGGKTFVCIGCWQDIDVNNPHAEETAKEYTTRIQTNGKGAENGKKKRKSKQDRKAENVTAD